MSRLKTVLIVFICLACTGCEKGAFDCFLTSHLYKDNYGEGKCIEGNCENGKGTLQETDGKFYRLHIGEFKEGKLWNGNVMGQLPEGKSRLIYVIKQGKVVVDAR